VRDVSICEIATHITSYSYHKPLNKRSVTQLIEYYHHVFEIVPAYFSFLNYTNTTIAFGIDVMKAWSLLSLLNYNWIFLSPSLRLIFKAVKTKLSILQLKQTNDRFQYVEER
jgi:hypothetical protein